MRIGRWFLSPVFLVAGFLLWVFIGLDYQKGRRKDIEISAPHRPLSDYSIFRGRQTPYQ